MERQCTKCGVSKPLDAFCRVKRKKDGRNNECRECVRIRDRNRNGEPTKSRGWRQIIERNGIQHLECKSCEEVKPVSEFHKCKRTRVPYQNNCKDCASRLSREWWHSDHEENKRKGRERHANMVEKVDGHAARIFYAIKHRCKTNGLDLGLTKEWIESRLKTGRCEATNVELYRGRVKGYREKRPNSPSVDRIDPEKGYTQDNCRLVCWWFNLAKSSWTDEVVDKFCRARLSFKTSRSDRTESRTEEVK